MGAARNAPGGVLLLRTSGLQQCQAVLVCRTGIPADRCSGSSGTEGEPGGAHGELVPCMQSLVVQAGSSGAGAVLYEISNVLCTDPI